VRCSDRGDSVVRAFFGKKADYVKARSSDAGPLDAIEAEGGYAQSALPYQGESRTSAGL
jgi:hypothetical protein